MKDAFILNTGPSLNLITEDEKDHVRNSITISTNSYLIWHELIDIVPDYHIFIDNDLNASAIIEETLKKHKERGLRTKLIFSKQNYNSHKKLFKNYGITPHHLIKTYHAASWATNIDEAFFHMNISGVALNWCVLQHGVEYNFKFLGYDGGPKAYFWSPTALYLNKNKLYGNFDEKNFKFILPRRIDRIPHSAESFFNTCRGTLERVAKEHGFQDRLFICNPNSKMLQTPFKYIGIISQ